MRRSILVMVALLLATASRASLGPPVSVALLGEPRAAREGEPYPGTLFVETDAAITLSGLRLEGRGWTGAFLKAPAVIEAAAGERLVFEFSARPADPDEPLVVAFEWNGNPYRKSFDLSESRVRLVREGGRAVPAPADARIPEGVRTAPVGPGPVETPLREAVWQAKRAELPSVPDEVEDESAPTKAAYEIRVTGRWIYWRNDGRPIGADACMVEVFDHDYMSPPDRVAVTTTNEWGYFDVTFSWDSIDEPDLFVVFTIRNSKVEVTDEAWLLPYLWSTSVHHNFDGTLLSLGILQPPEEGYPALHILNGLTRTWRWFDDLGYDARPVEVWWPQDDISSYSHVHERIRICASSQWSEATQSHEYGHHWMNCFATVDNPDYCNGYCDEGDGCGHCTWCPENEQDAWQEGFADYAGRVVPMSYEERYLVAATSLKGVAHLDTCDGDHLMHDPDVTEGFIAAALVDIHDASPDSHLVYGEFCDRLTMGSEEILSLVDEVDPRSPSEFLMAFKSRNPSVGEELWETVKNCGWDIDEEDPAQVTDLTSLTHTVGVASINPEVCMAWTRAEDDCSGVTGYSISWSRYVPELPDSWSDIDNDWAVWSEPLAAGTWYFNIRSRDRSGNWDDTAASFGPIVIREPEAADLSYWEPADWDYELVPTSAGDHTSTTAHVSPLLRGNMLGTWYSISARNTGEVATSEAIRGAVYVDGEYRRYTELGTILAGQEFQTLNDGPIEVRGGRHALYYKLDSSNDIAEPDESDNYYGRQFVWTPEPMVADSVYWQSPAPRWDAGWDYMEHGATLFFACDGFRFRSSGWWNAVTVWADRIWDDYDLALHSPATSAEDGFGAIHRHSGRGPGCLDAVIVNRNTLGAQDWDVGVRNMWELDTHSYLLTQATSPAAFASYGSYGVTLGEGEFLAVRELYVGEDDLGPISVYVSTYPPASPLYLQWRGPDYTYGTLSEADLEVATDADGRAHMMLDLTESCYTGLLLFRDPVDGDDPVTIVLDIKPTPPDMKPYFAAGWHSPMVPRPADDGTTTLVGQPDTLQGDAAATWYNVALWNDSHGNAPSVDATVMVDGQPDTTLHYGLFTGGATSRWNMSTPRTVRGGRHTLSLWLDPEDVLPEVSDENNWYGEQYVWSPVPIAVGDSGVRVPPPERTAGWSEIGSGEALWYNCDGLRMSPQPDRYWLAMAAVPALECDVDVRLHESLVGAKDGFAGNLVYSAWGTSQLDFVLANFHETAPRTLDVGVLHAEGVGSYVYECVQEEPFGSVPGGTGSVVMDAYEVLDLYEIALSAGRYQVELRVKSGPGIDWGVSLHPAGMPFLSKSMIVAGGASWQHGPDENESFTVDVTAPGSYCLAAWKVGSADFRRSGAYELAVQPDLTGVEGGPPPVVTALGSIYPNPFNPQVNVELDLARDGAVRMVVYDALGKRTRTLLSERLAAGRHLVRWDGTDDAGRRAASGVYYLRLEAGDVRESRKMVLLK